MPKAVCLHSGGLDSTTLLYHLRSMGMEVFPIGVHYGQRHHRELVSANTIYEKGNFQGAQMVNLANLQDVLRGSSQTDPDVDVPEGHYSADNMAITVVPNRNMILISIAVAYAISLKAGIVAYAAHIGDHDQYPDCRQVFIHAITNAIKLCDNSPPTLIAPFAGLSKAQIAGRAKVLEVPVELTYSCYKGRVKHCGRCGTCVERLEALHLAGVEDRTEYEDSQFWRTVTNIRGLDTMRGTELLLVRCSNCQGEVPPAPAGCIKCGMMPPEYHPL